MTRSRCIPLLERLIAKFEGRYGNRTYALANLPDSYTQSMIGGIVGFEMTIESLEGKFKLGQERTPGDKAGILEHLKSAKPEPSLHDLTVSFYKYAQKPPK